MKIGRVMAFIFFLFLFSCSKGGLLVSVPDNYRNWSQTAEGILDTPISGHTSPYRRIFINDTAERVNFDGERNAYVYPKGSIILKEILPAPDAVPEAFTIMLKDPENRYALGGWVWLIKDPGSGKETIVDNDFCFSCHVYANEIHNYGDMNPQGQDRDYVFYPYIKK